MSDILITTSLDPRGQNDLADRYLGKHTSVSYSVDRETKAPGVLHLSSAFEVLEYTINNPHVLTLVMSSFAISLGVKIAGLVGKAFEAVAAEFGKDVYEWLKASLHRGAHDSKTRDANRDPDDRLGELRVIIRGFVVDRAPFFAYIYYRYAEIHSDKAFAVTDDQLEKKTVEFFAFVLPFVAYLLRSSPIFVKETDTVTMQTVIGDEDESWAVSLPSFLFFTVLPTKEIEIRNLLKNDAQQELLKKRYREFLGATGFKSPSTIVG